MFKKLIAILSTSLILTPTTLAQEPALSSSGDYYIYNDNIPYFSNEFLEQTSGITYQELDGYGRAQAAYGVLSPDTRPNNLNRKDYPISNIYPSGWKQGRYPFIPSGGWLYNRSHLIGWQLAGADNPEINNSNVNLITGTRQLNAPGMLEFENFIDDYIERTLNSVHYRVTPLFKSDEALARGVILEALDVDNPSKLSMNVYIPNTQEGVILNYKTGEHRLADPGEEQPIELFDHPNAPQEPNESTTKEPEITTSVEITTTEESTTKTPEETTIKSPEETTTKTPDITKTPNIVEESTTKTPNTVKESTTKPTNELTTKTTRETTTKVSQTQTSNKKSKSEKVVSTGFVSAKYYILVLLTIAAILLWLRFKDK